MQLPTTTSHAPAFRLHHRPRSTWPVCWRSRPRSSSQISQQMPTSSRASGPRTPQATILWAGWVAQLEHQAQPLLRKAVKTAAQRLRTTTWESNGLDTAAAVRAVVRGGRCLLWRTSAWPWASTVSTSSGASSTGDAGVVCHDVATALHRLRSKVILQVHLDMHCWRWEVSRGVRKVDLATRNHSPIYGAACFVQVAVHLNKQSDTQTPEQSACDSVSICSWSACT